MKKRFLAMTMAAVLCLGLAGCGGGAVQAGGKSSIKVAVLL